MICIVCSGQQINKVVFYLSKHSGVIENFRINSFDSHDLAYRVYCIDVVKSYFTDYLFLLKCFESSAASSVALVSIHAMTLYRGSLFSSRKNFIPAKVRRNDQGELYEQ